jgi:hypothetical protein
MAVKLTDMNMDYEIEYEPPLDVFNFPIEPYEDWDASSDMTITLNSLSGTFAYDISGDIPGEDFTEQSGTVELGQEVSLPDTYGPISVYYSFDNYGEEYCEGYSDCIVIQGYQGSGSYYDYYYDTDYGGSDYNDYYYDDYDDDSSMMDDLDELKYFDAEAASEFNPVDIFMTSENYYSPDEGMIVQSDMSESDGGFPGVSGDGPMSSFDAASGAFGEMTMEPATQADVLNFKDTQRKDMEEQYSDIKEAESGDDSSMGIMFWIMIAAIAVVIVLIIVALRMKSKQKGSAQQPYYQPTGTQPQQPYPPQGPPPTQQQPYYQQQPPPAPPPQSPPSGPQSAPVQPAPQPQTPYPPPPAPPPPPGY